MTETRGAAVVEQANDHSILNTNPALTIGAVVSSIIAVAVLLVSFGIITDDQRRAVEAQALPIITLLFILIPLMQGIITRERVYSPRTAAVIAVTNAKQPAGAPPTLAPPP